MARKTGIPLVLYPFNCDEGIVKIKITKAKRVTHFAVVLALVSSLLSFLATPSNAVAPNPCVTKTTRIGSDTVVQFLRTGTCTWTIPSDVKQLRGLIVGGGGGGGGGGLAGGGGGGGGYVEFNSLTVDNQEITITVGSGGSRDPNGNIGASNGGASSVVSAGFTLIAEGGGAGGTFTSTYAYFPPAIAPRNGGSGGGSNQASYGNSTKPFPVIDGQEVNPGSQTAIDIGLLLKGNEGSGTCEPDDRRPIAAGGGGGAGGPATCVTVTKDSQSSFSGNGGIGYQNNILGIDFYWAGGGGGSNFVYSNDQSQPVFNGGGGGSGGGGGGGASDQELSSNPRSSGTDDANGLNPATRAAGAGAGVGGNGGANTGGGGGAGSHGGSGGLGGNGGSGIVVLRYATPAGTPDPSNDATLNSATIKGVAVSSLGTGAATIGSVEAGSVTLPDSVVAGSGITSFNLSVPNITGVPEAIVKSVLLTSNENILATFNSSEEYSGGTITPNSFFVVKVISQDGAATKYYRINITITDTTPPIISITLPLPVFLYAGLGHIAQDEINEYLELPTATATDNVDGELPLPALTYATNGSYGCVDVNDLARVKTCLNTVGNYVDFIFSAQDAAENSGTQTIRIKSVPGDSPILTYREPILKGDNEPEIRLDISGLYQYAGISNNYTEAETEDGEFSNQEFYINTFETGLKVKRINSTDDGDVHIFFYGPATGPGRVTVRAYASAFLHSFPEDDSNLLSIPIICDGATVACAVGDTGPGGGTIFYVESNSDGIASDAPECATGCKYLEAAATSGNNIWYDFGIEDEGFTWSENTTDHVNDTELAIGTGYSNTLKILNIQGVGTGGAAYSARNYQGGGKTDWYLPSILELVQLGVQSEIVIAVGAYWSSSEEVCPTNIGCGLKAKNAGIENGESEDGENSKGELKKVRPIRAFGAIANNEVIVPCSGGGSFTIVGTSVQSSSTSPQCAGSVIIPTGVTVVSNNAFSGQGSITSVSIPDSVETIGTGAFSSLSLLTSLTIGNGVRTISDNAFSGSASLRSVIIPEGVRFIGAFAFEEDYRLETLTIPTTVESIGSGAFDGTTALQSFQYCGTRLGTEDFVFAGLGTKERLPCPAPPAPPIRRDSTPTPTPAPPPAPTPTPAPPVTTNLQPSTEMLKVGTVYMSTNSYFLNNATKNLLRKLAKEIRASNKNVVLVYGYTDNRGGVNNTWLSRQRAKAVANFIRPMLKGKKIVIGWYASGKPVSTGTTAAALALNRRVEIYTK